MSLPLSLQSAGNQEKSICLLCKQRAYVFSQLIAEA
jgi:hypothetical protein